MTTTSFFEAAIANLRESTMRLIFFLEESPNELRSLVDFLNRQLKATEVLLVEARLYDSPAGRVVVPWLFGYTEEARVAKRESRTQANTGSNQGEIAYRTAVDESSLPVEVKSTIKALLEAFPISDSMPGWVFRVNAIFMMPPMMKSRGLFHLGRNGDIQFYFGYWSPGSANDVSQKQVEFKDDFAKQVAELLALKFNEQQLRGFPSIKASQWTPRFPEFVSLLKRIATCQHADKT